MGQNMQDGLQPQYIKIPEVKPDYTDPMASFIKMCQIIPASKQSPLFMLDAHQPLFVCQLRRVFRALCQEIGLDVQAISLHLLRHGGASEAYDKGASPLDIQRHGGWHTATF